MLKKIIIIFAAILSITALVSSSLFLNSKSSDKNDDGGANQPPITEENEIINIHSLNNVKTIFYVGDETPDFTKYFEIYENLNKIEVVDEYINTNFDSSEAGEYYVSCEYKNELSTIGLSVVDDVSVTAKEQLYFVYVGGTLEDYSTYFDFKINGETQLITEEMIINGVDFSTEGDYLLTCTYNNISAITTIRVLPQPTPEPEPEPIEKDANYDYTLYGKYYIGIKKDRTVTVGTILNLNDYVKYYTDEKEVTFRTQFENNINPYMHGIYTVNATIYIDAKAYEFSFNIEYIDVDEVFITDEEIIKNHNTYHQTTIEDWKGNYTYENTEFTFFKYNSDSYNIVSNGPLAADGAPFYGFIFVYDYNSLDDLLTYNYLMEYMKKYSGRSDIILPRISAIEINGEIEKYQNLYDEDPSEDNLTKLNIVKAIKNGEYKTILDIEDYSEDDLNVFGSYIFAIEGQKTVLERANSSFTFKMYEQYLNFMLGIE